MYCSIILKKRRLKKEANANHVATAKPRKAKGQEKQENPVESPIVVVERTFRCRYCTG